MSRPRHDFVAFDLETTGLAPGTDRVVEVGAVRFDTDGLELDRFESLVRPGRPVFCGALAVHGLTDALLAVAPPPDKVLPSFVSWLGDPAATTILAHNARFDAAFLGAELARLGRPCPGHAVTDTLDLARRRMPDAHSHRLGTLAELLNLDHGGRHRALADSRRVMGLWLALDGASATREGARLSTYPIFDGARHESAPRGWEALTDAVARGLTVRLIYEGGTLGLTPREITPLRMLHKGGLAYVLALCHHDTREKAFRLDRIAAYEVIGRRPPRTIP